MKAMPDDHFDVLTVQMASFALSGDYTAMTFSTNIITKSAEEKDRKELPTETCTFTVNLVYSK